MAAQSLVIEACSWTSITGGIGRAWRWTSHELGHCARFIRFHISSTLAIGGGDFTNGY